VQCRLQTRSAAEIRLVPNFEILPWTSLAKIIFEADRYKITTTIPSHPLIRPWTSSSSQKRIDIQNYYLDNLIQKTFSSADSIYRKTDPSNRAPASSRDPHPSWDFPGNSTEEQSATRPWKAHHSPLPYLNRQYAKRYKVLRCARRKWPSALTFDLTYTYSYARYHRMRPKQSWRRHTELVL